MLEVQDKKKRSKYFDILDDNDKPKTSKYADILDAEVKQDLPDVTKPEFQESISKLGQLKQEDVIDKLKDRELTDIEFNELGGSSEERKQNWDKLLQLKKEKPTNVFETLLKDTTAIPESTLSTQAPIKQEDVVTFEDMAKEIEKQQRFEEGRKRLVKSLDDYRKGANVFGIPNEMVLDYERKKKIKDNPYLMTQEEAEQYYKDNQHVLRDLTNTSRRMLKDIPVIGQLANTLLYHVNPEGFQYAVADELRQKGAVDQYSDYAAEFAGSLAGLFSIGGGIHQGINTLKSIETLAKTNPEIAKALSAFIAGTTYGGLGEAEKLGAGLVTPEGAIANSLASGVVWTAFSRVGTKDWLNVGKNVTPTVIPKGQTLKGFVPKYSAILQGQPVQVGYVKDKGYLSKLITNWMIDTGIVTGISTASHKVAKAVDDSEKNDTSLVQELQKQFTEIDLTQLGIEFAINAMFTGSIPRQYGRVDVPPSMRDSKVFERKLLPGEREVDATVRETMKPVSPTTPKDVSRPVEVKTTVPPPTKPEAPPPAEQEGLFYEPPALEPQTGPTLEQRAKSISDLATKMARGYTDLTAEEQQLQKEYPNFLNDKISEVQESPEYKQEQIDQRRAEKQKRKLDDKNYVELSRQFRHAQRKRDMFDLDELSSAVEDITTPETKTKALKLLTEAKAYNDNLVKKNQLTIENVARKKFGTTEVNKLTEDQQKDVLNEYNEMRKQGISDFRQLRTIKPITEKGDEDAVQIKTSESLPLEPETEYSGEILAGDVEPGLQAITGEEAETKITETKPEEIDTERQGEEETRIVKDKPEDDFFIETDPSQAQKEAGNYKKGHVKRDGLDISLENLKGSTRSGIDKGGQKWEVEMKNDYGYIKGTVGKDKDHLDVFLAENYQEDAPVFIVNQTTPDGKFDEHKVMLGFTDKAEAEQSYISNYEEGKANYSDIVEMPIEAFKKWSQDEQLTKKPAIIPEEAVDNNKAAIKRMLGQGKSFKQIAEALNIKVEDVIRAQLNSIGTNKLGEPLYQDEKGVRYKLEGNIRISEPVELTPTKGGMVKSVDREKEEWLTTEELKARKKEDKEPTIVRTDLTTGETVDPLVNKYANMVNEASLKDAIKWRTEQNRPYTKEEIEQIREKDLPRFIDDYTRIKQEIEDGNIEYLQKRLHSGNKYSRQFFEEMTGFSLGKTNKELPDKLNEWLKKSKERGEDEPKSRTKQVDTGRGEEVSDESATTRGISESDSGRKGTGKGTGISKGETDEGLPDTKSDLEQPGSKPELPTESTGVEGQPTISDTKRDTPEPGQDRVVSEPTGKDSGNVNYDLTNKPPVHLSKGQRRKINEQAKEILKSKSISELTEEDKDILRQYTGEGGLSSGEGKGALNQHYTDYPVIQAIYKALDQSGFKYKRALEPAVGSGNFVGMKPGLDWTTVDIDKTNHAVTSALYPKGTHYNLSYEKFVDKDFDLVISNVPFSEERGKGRLDARPEIKALHDFYFIHSLDRVKENGLIVFITSKGTMDKADNSIRKEILSKADVVAAFRLPGGTFEKNTQTDVITDIIFLQKRPDGIKPEGKQRAEDLLFYESTKTDDGIYLSKYYQEHPENILGKLVVGKNKLYGGGLTYNVEGEADLSKIKIKLNPYKTETVETSEFSRSDTEVPKKLKEFEEWAGENNTMYRLSINDLYGENIFVNKDGTQVYQRDIVHNFSDVNYTAKIYRPMNEPNTIGMARKIIQLDRLKKMADSIQQGSAAFNQDVVQNMIDAYATEFKTHPRKDKELKHFFKKNGEDSYLLELTSFITDQWTPEQVFTKQVRFEDSGRIEINEKSSLTDKALASENLYGEIDLSKAEYLSKSDLKRLLEKGYSYLGGNKIQNDILYYSGNIYKKIEQAQNIKTNDPDIANKIDEQIRKLEELKPEPKTIEDIDIRGNETWINDFRDRIFRYYTESFNAKSGRHLISTEYGKIYDNYLNNNQLVPLQWTDSDGKTHSFSEQEIKQKIAEAEDTIREVKEKIKNKVRRDPDLQRLVENEYNRRFKNYVKPDYTKASYIIQDILNELPKQTKDGRKFGLRKNQIDWIIKALYEGKGINAHDVGGGKTFAAIVVARALKKKGLAKKPIFVVPAKTIRKWERDIKFLYPDVNVINLGNLPSDRRKDLLFKVANTEADYVLISHEGFGQIKLSAKDELKYFDKIVSENVVDESKGGRSKELELEKIDRFREIIKRQPRDLKLTFDKLGFDAIIADEAHAFKNIGINADLVKFGAGIGFGVEEAKGRTEGESPVKLKSARSYDFRFKSQYITEKNNGKNVFLLTATPTPNKPMETFTMLRHLDTEILAEYGINTDRDFANTFLRFGSVSNPVKKKGFDNIVKSIVNAQELRSILDRYVDKLSMEQMPWIELPEANVINHYLRASDSARAIAEDIRRRIKALKSSWKPEPGEDTMLGIYTTGRSGSIDPRLYDSTHAGVSVYHRDMNTETDKIELAIKLVSETAKKKPRSGQIIFLDNAGHSSTKLTTNIHKEIKKQLVSKGLKPTQIAIISGQEVTNFKTGNERKISGNLLNEAKQELVDLYNEGKVRVIIGTTKSAGEGLDIQVKTTDIHHLDIPYTPSEFIQRNGRGVRYGNENDKVHVHYYFMRGTFDELSFNIVARKRGWNEAIWDKDAQNEIDTVSEMMGGMPSEEEIQLAMEENPIRRRELELEIERNRLSKNISDSKDGVRRAEGKIESLKRYKELSEEEIEKSLRRRDNVTEKLKDKQLSPQAIEQLQNERKSINSTLSYNRRFIEDYPERLAGLEKKLEYAQKILNDTEKDVTGFIKNYIPAGESIWGQITIPSTELQKIIKDNNLDEGWIYARPEIKSDVDTVINELLTLPKYKSISQKQAEVIGRFIQYQSVDLETFQKIDPDNIMTGMYSESKGTYQLEGVAKDFGDQIIIRQQGRGRIQKGEDFLPDDANIKELKAGKDERLSVKDSQGNAIKNEAHRSLKTFLDDSEVFADRETEIITKDNIVLSDRVWYDKYGYDPIEYGFREIKKGDKEYVEGEKRYAAIFRASFSPGRGYYKISERAEISDVAEEIIHDAEDTAYKRFPKVAKEIERWKSSVRGAFRRSGRKINDKALTELFAKSFLQQYGLESEIGDMFPLDKELYDAMLGIMNRSKSGENIFEANFPAQPEPAKEKKKPEPGFTFERTGKLEILNARPPPFAQPFYSKMQKVLTDKLPNSFNKEMLENILRSGEIKEAEIKWSGVEDWIASKQGKISKQELMDFLRANQLEVREVVKTGKMELSESDTKAIMDLADGEKYELDEGYTIVGQPHYYEIMQSGKVIADAETIDDIQRFLTEDNSKFTKFTQWTLPGGTNQREILFTLPSEKPLPFDKKKMKIEAKPHELVKGARDITVYYDNKFFFSVDGTFENNSQIETQARTRYIAERKHLEGVGYVVPEAHRYGDEADINRFAHARTNDRQVGKDKILHIEELQSDIEREIRSLEKLVEEGRATDENKTRLEQLKKLSPFNSKWHEYTLKNLIRKAAEEEYDGITWVTGEITADRYDLSKQVQYINIKSSLVPKVHKDITIKAGDSTIEFGIDEQGTITQGRIYQEKLVGKRLEDVVGKDVAEKIIKANVENRSKTLKGEDLKVGGEWAKTLYDKVIPNFLNKYGKKWGAKVGEIKIPVDIDPETATSSVSDEIANDGQFTAHSFPITESMKQSVLYEGQPLFSAKAEERQLSHGRKLYDQLKQDRGDKADIYPEWRRQMISEFGKMNEKQVRDLWREVKEYTPKTTDPKQIRESKEREAGIEQPITNEVIDNSEQFTFGMGMGQVFVDAKDNIKKVADSPFVNAVKGSKYLQEGKRLFNQFISPPPIEAELNSDFAPIYRIAEKKINRDYVEDQNRVLKSTMNNFKDYRNLSDGDKKSLAKILNDYHSELYLQTLYGGKAESLPLDKLIKQYKPGKEVEKILTQLDNLGKASLELIKQGEKEMLIEFKKKVSDVITEEEFLKIFPEFKAGWKYVENPIEAIDAVWNNDPNKRMKIADYLVEEKYKEWGKSFYVNLSRPLEADNYIVSLERPLTPTDIYPETGPMQTDKMERRFTYFKSKSEAEKFVKDMESEGWTLKSRINRVDELLKSQSDWDRIDTNTLLHLFNTSNVEIPKNVMEELLKSVKEGYWEKHTIRRNYTPGLKWTGEETEQNIVNLLAESSSKKNKVLGMAKMDRYLQDIEKKYGDMVRDPKANDKEIRKLQQTLDYSQRFVAGIKISNNRVLDSIRGMMYLWDLGFFRPGFMVQQTVENFQTVMNLAIEQGGIIGGEKAFISAGKDMGEIIISLIEEKLGKDITLKDKDLWYVITRLRNMEKVAPLGVKVLFGESGDPKIHYDTIGKGMDAVKNILGSGGQGIEYITRIQTAATFYRIAKRKGITDLDVIADYVADMIDLGKANYTKTGTIVALNPRSQRGFNEKTLGRALTQTFLVYKKWASANTGLYRYLWNKSKTSFFIKAMVGFGLHGIKKFPIIAGLYGIASFILGLLNEEPDKELQDIENTLNDSIGGNIGSLLNRGVGTYFGADISQLMQEGSALPSDVLGEKIQNIKSLEGLIYRSPDIILESVVGRPYSFIEDLASAAVAGTKLLTQDLPDKEKRTKQKKVIRALPSTIRSLIQPEILQEEGLKYGTQSIVRPEDIKEKDLMIRRLSFQPEHFSKRAEQVSAVSSMVKKKSDEAIKKINSGNHSEAKRIFDNLYEEVNKIDPYTENQKKSITNVNKFIRQYVLPRLKENDAKAIREWLNKPSTNRSRPTREVNTRTRPTRER